MKKSLLFLLTVVLSFNVFAQQYSLQGNVIDSAAYPIAYTTVSLLQPADSTLAFFSITNAEGKFEIKNISKGEYLMQVAFMGFKTYYKTVTIPYKADNFGAVVLIPLSKQLAEVNITGERIPIMINGDTVEYNAGAFKTKPDANVEELLKKLPGVQVDRSGNIKAQGETVNRVLVDGKEFFGNDPKVATQNLPADAINKVQVFNKKSDASEFTGIDDGSREKTINLMLKDGKKVGYFGDVQAGAGTDNRYKASGKIYRFKPTSQFAAIGLMNNINQPGFSFMDYMNFNGGMSSLMSGGQMNFDVDDAPVDFGQQVRGLVNSGAGGLNYSYEPRKNNRIAVSYLGNGSDKKLNQQTSTQNFSNNETFIRNDDMNENTQNFAHRLNLNIRKDIDSANQFTLAGNTTLSDSRTSNNTISTSAVRDVVLNNLDSRITENSRGLKTNATASYLRSTKSKWPVYKAGASITYDKSMSNTDWNNVTRIFALPVPQSDLQFQKNDVLKMNATANTSIMRTIVNGTYLEPELVAGYNTNHISRQQGVQNADIIDSLSPVYVRNYQWLKPGLRLSNTTGKKTLNIALQAEISNLSADINNIETRSDNYLFLLPSVNWQKEYGSGKRLYIGYNSVVNAPTGSQMLPVLNNTNPIQQYRGNNNLEPEYRHSANVNFIRFDQFNMSSLFASARTSYITNKIGWSRTINPDLTQSVMPVNVAYGFDASGRVEYSVPVRKLGINITPSVDERYVQGINRVNTIDNIARTLTHEVSLRVDNKKKQKIDAEIGGTVSFSNATYSVYKNLNNNFYNFTGFTAINYTPSDHWNFNASADVTQYNAKSFSNAVTIPIIKAEASYYFLKAKRGVLTANVFDLLNKNKGIERISELNYLRETTSNIIGRYLMLTFKYKIGKVSNSGLGNIDIKVGR